MLIFPVYYYKDIYIYIFKEKKNHVTRIILLLTSQDAKAFIWPSFTPNRDASMVLGKTQLVQRFKYVIALFLIFFFGLKN